MMISATLVNSNVFANVWIHENVPVGSNIILAMWQKGPSRIIEAGCLI